MERNPWSVQNTLLGNQGFAYIHNLYAVFVLKGKQKVTVIALKDLFADYPGRGQEFVAGSSLKEEFAKQFSVIGVDEHISVRILGYNDVQ